MKLEKYIKRLSFCYTFCYGSRCTTPRTGACYPFVFLFNLFLLFMILGRMVMFRFRNASCSAAKLCYFLLFLPSNLTLNILVTSCSTCSWETKSWRGRFCWLLSHTFFKAVSALSDSPCYFLYLLWTLLNPWALRCVFEIFLIFFIF